MKPAMVMTRVVVATGRGAIFRRNPDGSNDYVAGQVLSAGDVNRLGQDKYEQLVRYRFLREEAREVEVG